MCPKISFLGDVMAGENYFHFGRGIRSQYDNKYDKILSRTVIEKLFTQTDLIVYNFEYSLVDESFEFKDIDCSVYSAPINSLNIFPDSRIKIVNIANNHFSQHGEQRSLYTLEKLKEKNFIIIGQTNKDVKVKFDGLNFLFWGVSLVDDKNYSNIYFKSSVETLITDLKIPIKKEPNDIWIISIHWGTEYNTLPNDSQKMIAKKLVELGFDVVHGHHPHVIQPIEFIQNSIVFYSMGNFLFDQNFSQKTKKGLVANINFNSNNIDCTLFEVKSKRHIPHYIKLISTNQILLKKNNRVFTLLNSIFRYRYRLLMKIEFLPHVFKKRCYVTRQLLTRKQKQKS